jgi:hypothetical protein
MTGLAPSPYTWVVGVAGLAVGGLICFAVIHSAQRRQSLADRTARDLDRREDIYSRFIDQASEMWLDAFESPHDPANLIGLTALAGKIRLSSTRPVLEAAEAVIDFLLDTCQRPPRAVRDLVAEAPHEFMAPLNAFTAACRIEREKMLREL